jgi:hypothetical protein
LQCHDDAAAVAATARRVALPPSGLGHDAASGFWLDPKGTRWRLPVVATSDRPHHVCREVVTERNLLQAFAYQQLTPARSG